MYEIPSNHVSMVSRKGRNWEDGVETGTERVLCIGVCLKGSFVVSENLDRT